jgi:hypothetical protein
VFVIQVLAMLAVIASLFVCDSLLRHQYQSHRASWEQDGRPNGWFVLLDESLHYEGYRTQISQEHSMRVRGDRLRRTPEWAKSDPRALQLLLWYRALTLGGLAVMSVNAVAMLLFLWRS